MEHDSQRPRASRRAVASWLATFALLYFAGHLIGNWAYIAPYNVATFWPASGIFSAALVFSPRARWPLIISVALAVQLVSDVLVFDRPLAMSLGLGLAGITEAVVAAVIVLAIARPPYPTVTVRLILAVGLASAIAPIASAVVGASTIAYYRPDAVFWQSAQTWWCADALGLLLLGTAIVVCLPGVRQMLLRTRERAVELALLVATMAVFTYLAFGNDTLAAKAALNIPYVVFPVLFWAAIRFGAPMVAVLSLGMTLAAIHFLHTGRGPFWVHSSTVYEQVLALQVCAAVTAFTSILLAAVHQELRQTVAERETEIVERRRAEEAQDKLIAILEATPDFVGIAGPDGRARFVNRAGRSMIGLPEDGAIEDLRIADFHPPEAAKRVQTQAIPCAVRDGFWSGENTFLSRDGRHIPTLQVFIAHKSDTGELDQFSTIARDISDLKAAEQEIRTFNQELETRVEQRTADLQRANDELETFAYTVSHDLRTPLRAMSGSVEMLRLDYGEQLDADAHAHLDRAAGAIGRMGELIEDLLELSRLAQTPLNRGTVDLSALAASIVDRMRTADPERAVSVDIEDGMEADCDPGLLGVALENLIGNAWKFTRTRSPAVIRLFRETVEGETAYCVQDNGVGFDMSYSDKLFRPFQRLHAVTDFEGTGVGLATVERIVHKHGGRIWAESTKGAGTIFRFALSPA